MRGRADLFIVTIEATSTSTGHVHCVHLADGKLVQLSGFIGEPELPTLRLALLTPLFDECRDVVVDAGEVLGIDDEAVAVLAAAREWADVAGARILLSRSSPEFDSVLAELDMTELLPRLAPLEPGQPTLTSLSLVPTPRDALD